MRSCKVIISLWANRFYSSQGIKLLKLIKVEKYTLPKAILEGVLIYIPFERELELVVEEWDKFHELLLRQAQKGD